MKIDVKYKAEEGSNYPAYSTDGAAGADIYSREKAVLFPGYRKLIHTGIRVEIPEGYEMQIRPRSGIALKNGVTVLNAPGTIDSDYRGEIGVLLINLSSEPFFVNPGDRIAQGVLSPVVQANFIPVTTSLSETERGEGGYGSTGVSSEETTTTPEE